MVVFSGFVYCVQVGWRASGIAEVEGETLIIGPLGSNTSQAFFGRHRAWRLYKGIFDGGGADETIESAQCVLIWSATCLVRES